MGNNNKGNVSRTAVNSGVNGDFKTGRANSAGVLLATEYKQRITKRAINFSIYGNLVLGIFKLGAGIFAQSAAMVSDAVHSLSDLFSTFIVIIGLKAAAKEADDCHPYGHERFECVAAILLAGMLFVIGAGIGIAGLEQVLFEETADIPVPGTLALVAAISSIVIKEIMYRYTRLVALKIESSALMADAWHHRSDALSSIGSFAGILGARLGYPALDPLAAVIIAIFIIKAAVEIFIDAVRKMTDEACDETIVREMRELILAQPEVEGIDALHTRLFGDKIYVDVEISTNGATTLDHAHKIAHRVHDAIEAEFPKVKHCMVHVNPVAGGLS